MKKQLTTWEAACIITGYGIGGGVLAMPYLAERNGIILSLVILLAAFAGSYLLHLMIAELALRNMEDPQLISVFSKYLFRGKLKGALTVGFFIIMVLVLFTNLAAYITGAGEIIEALFGIPLIWAEVIFYIVAAAVVFFGLKAVGVSEKLAVAVIFALIAVLAVFSFFRVHNPLPVAVGSVNDALAYFGMAMFAFSAFFSVPQAVEGLSGDKRRIKKAVLLGLLNNLILITIISVCALIASTEVTEVAMIGWSRGIGEWAEIVGSAFTVLAMLTTYWSISLALRDIVSEQLKWNERLCWLIATLPSLILALLGLGGFMEFMRLAGGLIAIIVALMVVPAYYIATKGEKTMLGSRPALPCILALIAYILMGIGSVVPV